MAHRPCFSSLVVFYISVLLLRDVLSSTQAKGSTEVADGELLYANFFHFPGRKLWTTEIEFRAVDNDEECIQACTEKHQCRSVNLKNLSGRNGNLICYLLDSDKFRSSESFNKSADFDHYSLAAPCEHNPCLNGGSCLPVYEERDFKCACQPGLKGKRCDEGYKNCGELFNAGFQKSGNYFINQSKVFQVYCDQTNGGGGWTMVFKVVSGVPADIYQMWSTVGTQNENITEALNTVASFRQHYKNRLVQNWQEVAPKEVRLSLYEKGSEVLSIVFNATGSTRDSWFSKDRLISSPWTDFNTELQNYFSVPGDIALKRWFFINRNYAVCEVDAGWLLIIGGDSCLYENRLPDVTVVYSKLKTYTSWSAFENVGIADVMLVFTR